MNLYMEEFMSQNIIVGGAWPYANNSLHLGHLAGLISGDVLARYHRLIGDNVLYVSRNRLSWYTNNRKS